MAHLVFPDVTSVRRFAALIEAASGLPSVGVRVGGGVHVEGAETTRLQLILKHRTLSRWAYHESSDVISREATVPVPGTAVRQTLDATWNDATQSARAPNPEI